MKVNGEKIAKAVKGVGLVALGFITGAAYVGVQVAKAMASVATAAAIQIGQTQETQEKEVTEEKEEEVAEEKTEDDAE